MSERAKPTPSDVERAREVVKKHLPESYEKQFTFIHELVADIASIRAEGSAERAKLEAALPEREFFHLDRNRLADENRSLRSAMEKAGQLISYAGQDAVSSVIAEANRNQAWHVLVANLNTPALPQPAESGAGK